MSFDKKFSSINNPESHHDLRDWKEEGFVAEKRLNQVNGPLIEIGGPTNEYGLVDRSELNKKIQVSNIYPGKPIFNGKTGEFVGYAGDVDFIADGTNMPLKDNSVGGIFCSCLGPTALEQSLTHDSYSLRETVSKEAKRMLEPGGILVWQSGRDVDYNYFQDQGFRLLQIKIQPKDKDNNDSYNYIFEKPH